MLGSKITNLTGKMRTSSYDLSNPQGVMYYAGSFEDEEYQEN